MQAIDTSLPDVKRFKPRVFKDERGCFFESFNEKAFHEAIGAAPGTWRFVQDNHSQSTLGVMRGLHYQIEQAQGKLVRVARGAVLDVVVDIRRSSKTFGQHATFELSEANGELLWVPPGYAHGFMALTEQVDFLYKTTDYYAPQFERTLLWNDPALGITWPNISPVINGKDLQGKALALADTYA
jgi:dTDP-4-dehydrorhamnose 3,5-epimerase